jgi:hypothetical protein
MSAAEQDGTAVTHYIIPTVMSAAEQDGTAVTHHNFVQEVVGSYLGCEPAILKVS